MNSMANNIVTKLVRNSKKLLSRSISTSSIKQNENASYPTYKPVKNSPVWSWNEWDTLEEVVVGSPDNAVLPKLGVDMLATFGSKRAGFFKKHGGKTFEEVMGPELWKKVVNDVEEFVRVLEGEGVKVVRPKAIDYSKEFVAPNFKQTGLYAAMPRDFLIIAGDEMIEATMTWRSRYFEYEAYRPLIREYFEKGAKWTAVPKCTMEDGLYDLNYNEDQKDPFKYVVTDLEPAFDAADIMRCGKDWFYHISHVSNRSALKWLRRHLAPKGIRVHEIEFNELHSMHLDTTFIPLKPGLVLIKNGAECRTSDLIEKSGWDVVRSPHLPYLPHHAEYMNYYGLPCNILSIDQERIVVDKSSPDMIECIRNLGMKPVEVDLRHANNLGGGFHCWTTDIRRTGNFENYFNWSDEILERCTDK